MSGITLDAGALVAFEKNNRTMVALLQRAIDAQLEVTIPAGVVGQVWRDGRRQARLSRLLSSSAVEIEPLDDFRARAAGQLCGAARSRDVIDASVVVCARRRGHAVVTSDAGDLRRLDPRLRLVEV